MANKLDCVELSLACADVCRALDRGGEGKASDFLSGNKRNKRRKVMKAITF